MEGEAIYFNTSRLEEGGFSSSTPSALLLPSSLPSIQQMRFYFRQYLHHGGGELKRRLLAEAEKHDNCLLHVDLSDLKSYQHHIEEADLKCVDTPYCKKRQHAAPPDFAHQLVKVKCPKLSLSLCLFLSLCVPSSLSVSRSSLSFVASVPFWLSGRRGVDEELKQRGKKAHTGRKRGSFLEEERRRPACIGPLFGVECIIVVSMLS